MLSPCAYSRTEANAVHQGTLFFAGAPLSY
jgi:hypothetical protein